jgi:hypothetical protein
MICGCVPRAVYLRKARRPQLSFGKIGKTKLVLSLHARTNSAVRALANLAAHPHR